MEPIKNSSPAVSAERIAHYYNANTSHFLRLGGSGNTAAIHRAIWAPGVINKDQAFTYLNALVADAVQPLLGAAPGNVHLLDLGCGVGGTSTWLAQALGIKVTGISLSMAQIEIAKERAQKLGLTQQVDFVLGDFTALPEMAPAHAACAIESFVHASDARAFFSMAAQQIKPGGRLVICDDFLNPPHTASALQWIGRFVRGWHLNNLQPVDSVLRQAELAGFRLLVAHDLSPYVRSFPTPLLWGVTTLTRLPVPWAYWHNLSGGSALQVCLRRGWTKYWALVWERQQSD